MVEKRLARGRRRTIPSSVAAYLSPEWFEQLNRAADRVGDALQCSAGIHLTIQQVVSGGPLGDVRYWVRVDDGTVAAGLGQADDPDATISQSYSTAVAVATGELDVEEALMAGRIRLSGNVAALIQHQEALLGLDAAFADVPRRTSYP